MSGSDARVMRGTTRRAALGVLAAPAVGALAALAGCTPGPRSAAGGPANASASRTPAVPSVDDVARARAVATSRRLLAAVTAATGIPAAVRAAVAAGHRAHLAALGSTGPTPAEPSATPSGTTPTETTGSAVATSAATARPAPAAVVRGEADGAREALRDVVRVGGELATLLVRVGAARAAQADVVARSADVALPRPVAAPAPSTSAPPAGSPSPSDSPPDSPPATTSAPAGATATGGDGPVATLEPTPTTSLPDEDVDALDRLAEAEHAAVFGYGVVVPRVAENRRDRARAVLDAHRVSRDAVEALVVAGGRTPPAALPAYDVDVPATPAAALALAARIESGVARVAAWSTGRGAGEVRAVAAGLAVAATRQQAEWLGAVPPFTT